MQGFAKINDDLSYWQKQTKPLFPDMTWNIPEQKSDTLSIIGGNSQNFSSIIRMAEFMERNFPIKQLRTVLPESLRNQLPSIENVGFAPATNSGSFNKSNELNQAFDFGSFTLLAGDISHNAETAIAITDAIKQSVNPLLITRDSIDLLAPTFGQIIDHPGLFLLGSMPQIQKVFRALYYPRMIMLTQPLVPVVETLHKFTLTYNNLTIITYHQNNIIVANNGQITTTNLADTSFTPISLWAGQLATKIVALNLYNPGKPLEATTAAIVAE